MTELLPVLHRRLFEPRKRQTKVRRCLEILDVTKVPAKGKVSPACCSATPLLVGFHNNDREAEYYRIRLSAVRCVERFKNPCVFLGSYSVALSMSK